MINRHNLYLANSNVNYLSRGLDAISGYCYAPLNYLCSNYPTKYVTEPKEYRVITIVNGKGEKHNLFERVENNGKDKGVLKIVKTIGAAITCIPAAIIGSLVGLGAYVISPELKKDYSDLSELFSTKMKENPNTSVSSNSLKDLNNYKNEFGLAFYKENIEGIVSNLKNLSKVNEKGHFLGDEVLNFINTGKYSVFSERIREIVLEMCKEKIKEDTGENAVGLNEHELNTWIDNKFIPNLKKHKLFKEMVESVQIKIWEKLFSSMTDMNEEKRASFFKDLLSYQALYENIKKINNQDPNISKEGLKEKIIEQRATMNSNIINLILPLEKKQGEGLGDKILKELGYTKEESEEESDIESSDDELNFKDAIDQTVVTELDTKIQESISQNEIKKITNTVLKEDPFENKEDDTILWS